MAQNANCASDIRKLGSVRNFIQIPSAKLCGKKTLFYGKNCQMMEIDSVQQEYRASSNPIRTWNRYREAYCTIGNQHAAPGVQTFTVRFYETCDAGVPLPHMLRDCRVRFINNHGLCSSQGDATSGWSNYQEVIDGIVQSENRGKRTSYDGADDALVDELTFELINVYDVSSVHFSPLTMEGSCAGVALAANDAVFDCSNGCGDSSCGCRTTCNDGTNTFYIPASCDADTAQNYLWYTRDGGETSQVLTLPAPSTGTAAIHPKIAQVNGRLYVLAYQNPPTLYSINLDNHGVPTGSWTEVATLGTTDGIPGALVEDNGLLHILVQASATGARFYTLGDGYDPGEGERHLFGITPNVSKIAVCGEDLYAVGETGYLDHSEDGGATWAPLTAPTSDDLTDVAVIGVALWVTGTNGAIYRSTDDGTTWTQVKLGDQTATVLDLTFAGDNLGWVSNGVDAPFSTALGGELAADWSNQKPRIANWPAAALPTGAILPTCADGPKAVNTVLMFATNADGDSLAYIGRGRTAGG